jgi:hypothetical protein
MTTQPRQLARPSCEAQIYASVPLPLGSSSSIRLLRILDSNPGDDNALISCKLRVASVDDPYIALSYMWGYTKATETIILNGLPLLIRKNLWDFLHQRRKDQRQSGIRQVPNEHHRSGAATSYLWIDALCIEQDSTVEKNHQVAMMGQIYSNATSVIAWLGSKHGDLRLWDGISHFASNPILYESKIERPVNISQERWNHECILILDHPYWKRAWILQECVLARELQVQCGSRLFPAAVLLEFALRFRPSSPYFRAVEVLKSREEWHDTSARKYFSPWSNYYPTVCFDPRDRIFAAVAIMDPVLNIITDYSKTAEELFVEIADQHIQWDSLRFYHLENLAYGHAPASMGSGSNDWKDAAPAVRQRLIEAQVFDFLRTIRPGLTKSEFLLHQQLLHEIRTSHIERNQQDHRRHLEE